MGTLTGAVVSAITPGSVTPIAPDAVTGLNLWLLADSIVGTEEGGHPTDWYADVGGWDFNQGDSSKRGQFNGSAVNGHAAMTFDGVDDYYRTTAAATSGTTPFGNATTQFWVIKPTYSANHGALYTWADPADGSGNHTLVYAPVRGGSPTTDSIFFDSGGDSTGGRILCTVPADWNDNWHVLEVYRNPVASGGAGEIVVDGVSLVSGTFTDDLEATFTEYIYMPTYHSGFALWPGSLAEWCNYSRVLTSTERAGVRLGLMNKYGIT